MRTMAPKDGGGTEQHQRILGTKQSVGVCRRTGTSTIPIWRLVWEHVVMSKDIQYLLLWGIISRQRQLGTFPAYHWTCMQLGRDRHMFWSLYICFYFAVVRYSFQIKTSASRKSKRTRGFCTWTRFPKVWRQHFCMKAFSIRFQQWLSNRTFSTFVHAFDSKKTDPV